MTHHWRGLVRSHDKLNTLYLHLQKIHRHQTKQGADLNDYVTNTRSRVNLKNLYHHFHQTWSGADSGEEVQQANA